MNIKKILTIVLTLVMGIALTGVLATNVNSVDNGYIEYEGNDYNFLRIVQDDIEGFVIYNENNDLVDENYSIKIYAKNVYVNDFSLDANWDNPKDVLFNKTHNTLELDIDFFGEIGLIVISNNNDIITLNANENISGGEIILIANETIKPITSILLSLVPLIFTGAIVAFIYNSRFD